MKLRLSVIAVTAAVLIAVAPWAQATTVHGTFSGTFVVGSNGNAIDTIGVFGTPGADLTGTSIAGSFNYDTTNLVNTVSGVPGEADWQAANAGWFTQTANGNTTTIPSNANFSMYIAAPPAVADDIVAYQVAGSTPSNPPVGSNFLYSYTILEYVSQTPFLNGLGPVQYFTLGPGSAVSGADEFQSWVYNPNTGGYNITVETLQFEVNLPTGIAPEPSTLLQLGTGLAGMAGLYFRRRHS